jgi:hypothetical protein
MSYGEYEPHLRIGGPHVQNPVDPRREIVTTAELVAGDSIQWESRYGTPRTRSISSVWPSKNHPGMICVMFSGNTLMADTFAATERWTRRRRSR